MDSNRHLCRPECQTEMSIASITQQCISRNVDNVRKLCDFLSEAMGPVHIQLDIGIPVQDLIRRNNLNVMRAPGDGHCLLHAWATGTNTSEGALKQALLDEYNHNMARYMNAAINPEQLMRYIESRNYALDAADVIVDMLCNATQTTAFIIGAKFDYTDARNPSVVPNVTEVRQIAALGLSTQNVLLLKTGEHYDCLC